MNLIYLIITGLILGSLFILPFVRVEVTIKSPAIIRPAINRTSVRALVSGIVRESHVRDNMIVKVFDTLYVLESNALQQKEQHLKLRASELSYRLDDINQLITHTQGKQSVPLQVLKTEYYRQAWSQHQQRQN